MVYLKLGYSGMYVGANTIDSSKTVTYTAPSTVVVGTDEYKAKYKINFMGGSVGIGKSFNGETRAEIEGIVQTKVEMDNANSVEYFTNDATNAYANKGFNFGAVFVNAYYDLSYDESVVPYIGGGIGVSRITFLSDPTSEAAAYPVALQLKAGISYKAKSILPYVGYRFIYLMQKEWTNTITAKNSATATTKLKAGYTLHNFDAGVIIAKMS
jgi:opacity protein-like surface antigen